MKDYRKQVELAMSTRREGLLPTVEKEIFCTALDYQNHSVRLEK